MSDTGIYVHRLTVPFGHCDIAGIVYTPRFTDYCMEAAEVFMQREVGLDWYAINLEGEYASPVMRVEVDFISTVHIGDELEIDIVVSKIGRSSYALGFSGNKGERGRSTPCFTATLVFAFVDMQRRQSIPIPGRYREQLRRCQQLGPQVDRDTAID